MQERKKKNNNNNNNNKRKTTWKEVAQLEVLKFTEGTSQMCHLLLFLYFHLSVFYLQECLSPLLH